MKRAAIPTQTLHFTTPRRRARLLADFDRGGISAAEFARQHGINCTTFHGWLQRRAKTKPPVQFAQVELPASTGPVELVIELGTQGRMRIGSAEQLPLAVRLIQSLNSPTSC